MVQVVVKLEYGSIECLKANTADAMNYIKSLKEGGYNVTSYSILKI